MTDENLPATQPAPERRPIEIIASERGFVPRNIDEVGRYARMLLVAGAVPDSLTKENGSRLPDNEIVSRVVAVIAAGSEIGMSPMSAMANIALINKRRLIWGQGAVAVLQASGQLEDMRVERLGQQPGDEIQTAQFSDSFGVKVILKRRGQPTPFIGEFTVGQAKRAHLWGNVNKKPWIEHPERMLFWRAFNNAASTGFADYLSGLGIREVFDEPAPQTQITDTSFLDAPRKEVVPDTERDRPSDADNAQPPVDVAGGEPPNFAAPRSSPEPETIVEPPPPARRRARRRREEPSTDMFRPRGPTPGEEGMLPDGGEYDPAAYEPDEDNPEPPPPESGNDR